MESAFGRFTNVFGLHAIDINMIRKQKWRVPGKVSGSLLNASFKLNNTGTRLVIGIIRVVFTKR